MQRRFFILFYLSCLTIIAQAQSHDLEFYLNERISNNPLLDRIPARMHKPPVIVVIGSFFIALPLFTVVFPSILHILFVEKGNKHLIID
jgi:hypothetical protein